MKKKRFEMLSLMVCLFFSFPLASCNGNKHEAKKEWSNDEAKHWHECLKEGHTDRFDEASHVWDDGIVTSQPTEAKEGVKTFKCTICSAEKKESVAKLAHTHTFDLAKWEKDETGHYHKATCPHDVKKDEAPHSFGNWKEKTPAGIHTDRVEERKCSICEFTEERTVSNTGLHDFDIENIRHDKMNHWYECSCGEKYELEAHTFGEWTEKTAAGVDQDREFSRKCTECLEEEVLSFANTKTNGTYCMAILDTFRMSGVQYFEVRMVRGAVTAGENLSVDGVEGEFSIGKIFDKKSRMELPSAAFGDVVLLQLEADSGDLGKIKAGSLAYLPDSVHVYDEFSAQIKIDRSDYAGSLNLGTRLYMDLYDTGTMMMSYRLVLPDGVISAEDGKSYLVQVSIPENVSRALWAGMDFSYKVYDSSSSSYKPVVKGTILDVKE